MAFRKAIKTLICSSCVALNDYKQSNNALNLAQDKYVTKGSEGCDSLQPEFRLHPETVGYKFNEDWDSKNSNQSGRKAMQLKKTVEVLSDAAFSILSLEILDSSL